jgi:hypothetical protein
MRQQQAYKYTGQRTNFFTLFRFDFMLDENHDIYLIEVCSSATEPWQLVWLARISPGMPQPGAQYFECG